MKALNCVLAVSLFFSQSAFAQNSELDRLAEASRSDVDSQAAAAALSDEQLLNEVLRLQYEVAEASRRANNWKQARTATIVITAAAATAIGFMAYKGNRSQSMNEAGAYIVGGVVATVATIGGGIGIGATHYAVKVRAADLEKLNDRLEVVKQELVKRLKDLRSN